MQWEILVVLSFTLPNQIPEFLLEADQNDLKIDSNNSWDSNQKRKNFSLRYLEITNI